MFKNKIKRIELHIPDHDNFRHESIFSEKTHTIHFLYFGITVRVYPTTPMKMYVRLTSPKLHGQCVKHEIKNIPQFTPTSLQAASELLEKTKSSQYLHE